MDDLIQELANHSRNQNAQNAAMNPTSLDTRASIDRDNLAFTVVSVFGIQAIDWTLE